MALRFVPYSDDHGHIHAGWAAVMVALGLIALAASIYLVYVLEILKFRRLRSLALRKDDPDTSEHQIDDEVRRELETGEYEAVEEPVSPSEDGRTSRAPTVRPRR